MSTKQRIDYLTIKGFKSIRSLDNLRLRSLNVLIGGNGVGKSNFVNYLRMLIEMMSGCVHICTGKMGGADRILSYGVKETTRPQPYVHSSRNGFAVELEPAVDGCFVFASEQPTYEGNLGENQQDLDSGYIESRLPDYAVRSGTYSRPGYSYNSIVNWKVYHVLDDQQYRSLLTSWYQDYLEHWLSSYYLKNKSPFVRFEANRQGLL